MMAKAIAIACICTSGDVLEEDLYLTSQPWRLRTFVQADALRRFRIQLRHRKPPESSSPAPRCRRHRDEWLQRPGRRQTRPIGGFT